MQGSLSLCPSQASCISVYVSTNGISWGFGTGTHMTPNYISNSSVAISLWCTCESSGNQKEECDQILGMFISNKCLSKCHVGCRPRWRFSLSKLNPVWLLLRSKAQPLRPALTCLFYTAVSLLVHATIPTLSALRCFCIFCHNGLILEVFPIKPSLITPVPSPRLASAFLTV